MEKCKKCGAEAEEHPIVAIMATEADQNSAGSLAAAGKFTAWAVCEPCWRDPAKPPNLKAHYHYREQWLNGLAGAESQIMLAEPDR